MTAEEAWVAVEPRVKAMPDTTQPVRVTHDELDALLAATPPLERFVRGKNYVLGVFGLEYEEVESL